jgi:hypothetical protein
MGRKNFYGSGNDSFTCEVCDNFVDKLNGGFRNHCTLCLHSKHVDIISGDRRESCAGIMKATDYKNHRKGWSILHVCQKCGFKKWNILAMDDDFEEMLKFK